MDEHMVERIVRRQLEGVFADRECPVCKGDTTMIKVSVWSDGDFRTKYRCMNCLTLFTEELQRDYIKG